MKTIGKLMFFLSFIIGAILLIISFTVGFGKDYFSDDFWLWLIAAISSFCLLFFTGRYLTNDLNNKKLKSSSKAQILKTIASISFVIGLILSIIIIIISFNSPEGFLGLFLILPIVFGLFFALGAVLLLIHYFMNRK